MANQSEIAEELERLALHCRPPLMSVEDRVRWLADWCEDLKGFDIAAVRTACQRWREGSEVRFPRQGQLIPMIRAAAPGQSEEPKQLPWRPLSEDEYQQLTLSEKARHQRIMAMEAGGKAGPQDRYVQAEDMPEQWQFWRRRAAEHNAEADRLWKKLKEAEARGLTERERA
jgi:hypothetical protein